MSKRAHWPLLVLGTLACAGVAANAWAAGDPARGQQKAQQVCQACHGSDGNSTDPQYPRLAGQYPDYMIKALKDYKSGARTNAIMAGFAGTLSDQERADLAAYYASQSEGLVTLPR
jgi:cytochrome c553